MMTWFIAFGCIGVGIKMLFDDRNNNRNDE